MQPADREDEKAFEDVWRRVGLSVDWSLLYTTIGDESRATAQRAFLRNLARGEAYVAEAPTLWDVTFRTAVAQAELEDREQPGAYHRIRFHADGPAGLHRDDPARAAARLRRARRPPRRRALPAAVRHVPCAPRCSASRCRSWRTASPSPDKGSGIAMICTFGDLTDVTWWRELDLPTRAILDWHGRILPEPPDGVAHAPYAELAGKTVHSARERVSSCCASPATWTASRAPITQPVKFYEKGDKPLEIVTTRQWYIRNGGRDAELRERLLARGAELNWHPRYMQARYENWVEGLAGDWLISRQRFFGVPIPVWYPVGPDGEPVHTEPITPPEDALPVDPSSDAPPGYTEDQRGKPDGFVGDPDVMDTWATSSLTPQIAGGWERDPELFAAVFPYDLRPQAHDIIRTWLFSTVVRAHLEHDSLPWAGAAISGWILDPDRKKMSKSKGNVVTPMDLLDQHGSDAVRYWAASGRLGTDTAFDTGQIKIGRRLAIKILNASKFVLGLGEVPDGTPVTDPLDLSMLATLEEVVREATAAFEANDYTRALERTERFFWNLCDDYLELVKSRAYGEGGEEGAAGSAASARAALRAALSAVLRLFAPILPYVTEEVWSWWQEGSVHRAAWPGAGELPSGGDPAVLAATSDVLRQVRRAKSAAKVSMRAEVDRAVVRGAGVRHLAVPDLRAAGRIADLDLDATPDEGFAVDVTLGD